MRSWGARTRVVVRSQCTWGVSNRAWAQVLINFFTQGILEVLWKEPKGHLGGSFVSFSSVSISPRTELNSVCSSLFRPWGQSNLTQPLLFSKTLGKNVSSSCAGNSMILGSHNEIWYQQHPGMASKLLVYYQYRALRCA